MKRRAMILSFLLLPGLLLAGCGGGGSGGGVAKTDYLAKAEAVCVKANADRKALPSPSGASDVAPYVRKLVDIAGRATTALAALSPPKADAAQLQAKVVGPLQAQLGDGQRFADDVEAAAKRNDNAALLGLVANPPNKTRADLPFMRKYGFKACVAAADTSS